MGGYLIAASSALITSKVVTEVASGQTGEKIFNTVSTGVSTGYEGVKEKMLAKQLEEERLRKEQEA